jgi:hypothetical protein
MENVGIKHGHITWPKHISTIRTLLAEGSIQCQSNQLSIKNETMSTTAFTAVYYITSSSFHCRVFNNEHEYVILLSNHFRLVCGQCIFRYTDV